MRLVLLLFTLITSLCSLSQSTFKSGASKTAEKSRWDLDRYVWSHTNYKTGKNDKPAIDFDAIDNWPTLGKAISISPDGKYFAYTINIGSSDKPDSLILQSTEGLWRQIFCKASPGFFSTDSKQYIFLEKETLHFVQVGKDEQKLIKEVRSYAIIGNNLSDWLVYQLKGQESSLILHDLKTGKERRFIGEYSYSFDKSAKWLILKQSNSKDLRLYNIETGKELSFSSVSSYKIDKGGKNILIIDSSGEASFIDLATLKSSLIWKSERSKQTVKEYGFDNSGTQVAFTVEDENKQISIWYWKQGMIGAVMKVDNNTTAIGDLVLQPSVKFTDNNRYIKFSLIPKPEKRKPIEDAVQLDIWAYTDAFIQSTQPDLIKNARPVVGIVNTENANTIILGNDLRTKVSGDWALVTKKNDQVWGDRFWENGYEKDSIWLVSLIDGRRRFLFVNRSDYKYFSPGGKYLVYYDSDKDCHWFSYELKTGNLKDISHDIPSRILERSDLFLHSKERSQYTRGLAAWIAEDKGVLAYDDYDIWLLDLEGKKPSQSLTHGFGRTNNTIFGLLDQFSELYEKPLKNSESVILTAFDFKEKYNGFYKLTLDKASNLEALFTGPRFIQSPGLIEQLNDYNTKTIKAINANSRILLMQTATDGPNYFLTKDFKTYKRLTNLQPQIDYNWLNVELVSFKQLDGSLTKGKLYKPENFDATKKYPVLIPFYTNHSDGLNQYLSPEYMVHSAIYDDPALLVSNGYLVLVPDIYFTQDLYGPSTVNTIEGAVRYLTTLPYVDIEHIGSAGHSNSGRFGNYLFTHSNSFAAMSLSTGHGATDVLSVALLNDDGLAWAEENAKGTGLGNIWQNKERWIDHISLLQTDKASSPLLLIHNKGDGDKLTYPLSSTGDAVMFAKQLFVALRRQEKPVWWLQYDEEGHFMQKLRDQRDFSVRYMQYFDHFLKNAPAPRWMCEGIAFKDKGIESKYELDPSGNCGLPDKPCAICNAWNKQYKRNSSMFQKPISDWKLDDDIQKELDKKETEQYNKNMVGEAQRIKENNDKLRGVWKGEKY